ncbi:dienelactone hydrolase family protein [Desmospora activa]|uniref:Dienelactone hydrolase n=1 Tax=Desmospora activa DSM 45169 TaxID=1121389 RepID=A0A2T4Z3W3_9BACL|nr:alpha/beta hydrolase family protein [Desmospora activa]PTM56565.1 dienelactone hydrolase [Desmospora activa DSM 45169]
MTSNWRPDHYLEQLAQQYQMKREAERHKQGWEQQREQIKERVRAALGDFHDPSPPELRPVRLEQKEYPAFIRERVEYTSLRHLRVPAYVLIPKERRGSVPAVLALHGHGYGSIEAVGLNPDGTESGEEGSHSRFALSLVKRGLVVIVPENIGFGDRRLKEDKEAKPGENSCYRLASQLLLFGRTLAGLRVAEAMRALDYLQGRAEVDADRIGCIGFSTGGMIAALTAAMDKRITATVISGYTNTFAGSIMARRHCLDNYLPGILHNAEMPEMIGLIAPRPLFIEAGTADHLFPLDQVKVALSQLKQIYGYYRAKECLDANLFAGGHKINGEKAYDWLKRMLITS